jgi:hypothetical protein
LNKKQKQKGQIIMVNKRKKETKIKEYTPLDEPTRFNQVDLEEHCQIVGSDTHS